VGRFDQYALKAGIQFTRYCGDAFVTELTE